MTQRVTSAVFAGRERELDALAAALAGAAEGSPTVVLVGGEAGIGKSRLLAELAAHAEGRGLRVLSGQCAGLEDAVIPLLPVVTALSGLGDDDAPDVVAASGRLADPSARAHAAALDRLAAAAAADPVLLLLEDIHWADRSTLDILAFLARHVRDEHLLVVATLRSDEIDRREGLRRFLAEVATAPRARRLELTGLGRAEMHAQIAGILGGAAPADLVDAVFTRSEGNPFFAEELVAAGAEGELSPSLRDVLLARIAALEPNAQAVVRVAAAGGRQVDHRLLAAAAGLEDRRLTEALRAAVRHQVLVARGDAFAFRHALLQEAAYAELLPGERAALHAAFAEALGARPELVGGATVTVAAEIAHHWRHTDDQPRALAAAVHAGAEADRVGALAEAADHDRFALAVWEAVPDAERVAGIDRATLLDRAAYATAWTGRPADGLDLVDAAIALVEPAAEPVRAALLRRRRGIYLWQLGRAADAACELERAVALIPARPPSAERARVLAHLGLMLLLSGDPGGAREPAEEALAIARDVGARAEETDALVCLGQALVAVGEMPRGLELGRRARLIAASLGDDELLSHTAVALSDGLRRQGELEQSVEMALSGAEESRRVGLGVRERLCLSNAAEAAFELGRWDQVDELCAHLLADDRSDTIVASAHHVAGSLARARGDLDGAERHLAGQREVLGPRPTAAERYDLEDEAELALCRRRPQDAARAAAEGVRAEAQDTARRLLMATLGLRAEADRADIARARRDDAGARSARDRARAFLDAARDGDAHAALAATAAAEHARVVGDAGPALWDAAAREWELRSSPFQAAYARWRQAEAALARRDREQGAQALRAAHATTTSLGAAGLLAEVEALARRARIALSDEAVEEAEPATGAHAAVAELGLTAREVEVLEHLALGQTNRQIADELFISIKTAGVHVSHILAKLGAANRSEAGAIAHRLGLVP